MGPAAPGMGSEALTKVTAGSSAALDCSLPVAPIWPESSLWPSSFQKSTTRSGTLVGAMVMLCVGLIDCLLIARVDRYSLCASEGGLEMRKRDAVFGLSLCTVCGVEFALTEQTCN